MPIVIFSLFAGIALFVYSIVYFSKNRKAEHYRRSSFLIFLFSGILLFISSVQALNHDAELVDIINNQIAESANAPAESTSAPVEEPAEEPKREEAEVGSRTNPVPFGETLVATGEITGANGESTNSEIMISLSNFVSGEEAMNYLLEQNQFNEQPPEGYEWLVFDVTLSANIENPNIPYYPMPTFNVIDSAGSPVSQDGMYATMDNQFGHVDIYDGGEATGKAAVVVPAGEEVLIEYKEFDIQAFFETE